MRSRKIAYDHRKHTNRAEGGFLSWGIFLGLRQRHTTQLSKAVHRLRHGRQVYEASDLAWLLLPDDWHVTRFLLESQPAPEFNERVFPSVLRKRILDP